MLLKVYKLKFLLAMLLVPFLAVAQPSGWGVQSTPFQHFISVNSATLTTAGLPVLENGDHIGVFFDDGATCGGYIEVNLALAQTLIAYGESPFPIPGVPGFAFGESFTWKFYDNSAPKEYVVSTVMTGDQVWTLGGNSVLTTLKAFAVTATATPDSFGAIGGFTDLAYANLTPVAFPIDSQKWYDGDMIEISTDPTVNVEVLETTVFTVEAVSGVDTASASVTVTVSAFTAGPDDEVCEEPYPMAYTLDDAVATSGYIGINWASLGDGTWMDKQTIHATYYPSAADVAGGMVTLTVTALNNFVPVSDAMELSFAPAAEITMFPDKLFLCADATNILDVADFAGLVEAENDSLIQWAWINATGGFTNENILEPIYQPGGQDLGIFDNDGNPIILTMQASSFHPCTMSDYDSVNLVFVRAPEDVSAGEGDSICLDGTVNSFTFSDAHVVWGANPWFDGIVQPFLTNNITWASSGNGTWTNETTATPTYHFSASELAGTVTINFTMTAQTMEACDPVVSQTSIVLQSAPTAYAGPDAVICEGEKFQFVGDIATNFSLIHWDGLNGTGDFSDAFALHPEYTPSFADILQGCVTLQIIASPIDPCVPSAQSQMELCIQRNPVVDAGDNATICANETFTTDSAKVEYSNGSYLWTQVGGAGNFDDPTLLHTTYTAVNPADAGAIVYLTLTAGPILPCQVAGTNTIELTILCAPDVWAGDDMTVCETENPELTGVADCVLQTMWATTGDGFFCCPDSLITTYYPGPNDKDGCVTLVLIGYPLYPCSLYELDKVNICFDPQPIVDAGLDKTVCEGGTIQIDGTASNECGINWTVLGGNGVFSNENIANPTYTPNGQDLIAGTVELVIFGAGCDACTGVLAADTMLLTIQRLPVVDIDEDETTICEDGTFDPADYVITVANEFSSAWSTSGDGAFDVDNIYTPGVNDISDTLVVLTLTAQPIDPPCTAEASDAIIIHIQLLPTAYAGPDATICEGTTFTFVDDAATKYSLIQWVGVSGTGDFLPNENVLHPEYVPSQTDVLQGCVLLAINVSPISPCVGYLATDTMNLCFQPPVNIDIDQDVTICEDATYTPEAYTLENACGVVWSSDGDGTWDDVNAEYPVYTLGVGDSAAGFVILHVTVEGCYNCSDVTMDIFVTIQPNPIADAGDDGVVCEYLCNQNCPPYDNGIYYDILGSVTHASSFYWESDGDGLFIPGANVLDPDYMLSDGDIADPDGEVVLCLIAEAIDPCTVADTSCMILTIQPFPVANAGPDQTVCEGETVLLAGSAQNFDGVFWDFALYGEGDGSWSNQIILDPVYTPGIADIDTGFVELIMVAFPISPCTFPDADRMTVFIIPQPTANAGMDETICENETIQLNGLVENATGGQHWEGGDGTFTPDVNDLNATYTPGSQDKLDGEVDLCLYAVDDSFCNAVYFDCLTLTINPIPTVVCPADFGVCIDATAFALAGATPLGGVYSGVGVDMGVFVPEVAGVGTFEIIYCYVDANMCENCCTFNITVNPLPVVVCPADFAVCEDADAFALEGATPEGGIYSGVGVDMGMFDPAVAGVGTFEIIYCYVDVNMCENCCTFNITVNPLPVADCPGDYFFCVGEEAVEFPVVDGGIYTNDLGEEVLGFDPVMAGIFTFTLTVTENGCSASCDFEIEVMALPEPYAGDDDTIGADETYTLADAAIENLQEDDWSWWETSGDGTFDPDAFALNAVYVPGEDDIENGSVELCLWVNSFYCGVDVFDCMTLTIFTGGCVNPPTAFAGDDAVVCANEVYVLAGAATNYTSVMWVSFGDGMFDDATALAPTYTPGAMDLMNGTVELCMTVQPSDVLCDPAMDCMMLGFNELPYVDFVLSDTEICLDETLYVTATGPEGGAYPYAITGTFNGEPVEGIMESMTEELELVAPEPGTYVAILTGIVDANGCSVVANDVFTVVVNPLPYIDVELSADEVCVGGSITLTATGPEMGAYPYQVSYTLAGGTFEIEMPSANEFLVFDEITEAGTYEGVLVSIVDANGCSAMPNEVFTVVVHPLPVAECPAYEAVCEGSDMIMFPEVDGGDYTDAEGTEVPGFDPMMAGTYMFTLTVTSEFGCIDFCGFEVVVNPLPYITLALDALEICLGETVTGTVTGPVDGFYPYTVVYTINGEEMTDMIDGTPLVIPLTPDVAGLYTLEVLSVVDANGCMAMEVEGLELTVLPLTEITMQPVSLIVEFSYPAEFSVEAVNATAYQWYLNDLPIAGATDATYSIESAMPEDAGNYYCEVMGECGNVMSETVTLTVEPWTQKIDFLGPVNGFSTYLELTEKRVATIFGGVPALQQVDFVSPNFTWVPGGLPYSLTEDKGAKVNIGTGGYPTFVEVTGYPTLGSTVDVPYSANGSYLPVWSQSVVLADDVFGPHIADIFAVFSMDYSGYWFPGYAFTLEYLVPGSSYSVLLYNDVTFDFDVPAVDAAPGYANLPRNITTWNDAVLTGTQHNIVITSDAMSQLEDGDVVGAFNEYNQMTGMVEITNTNEIAMLRTFGDNPFTKETEGFVEGDIMTIKVWRNGEEMIAQAAFDANLPNQNVFAENGVSAITSLKLGVTSINDFTSNLTASLYPNPATDLVNIKTNFEISNVKVVNYVGQVVFNQDVNQMNFQINTSNYGSGMYFVQIENLDGVVITKRLTVK